MGGDIWHIAIVLRVGMGDEFGGFVDTWDLSCSCRRSESCRPFILVYYYAGNTLNLAVVWTSVGTAE